jgi:hypothetical protein
MDAYSHSLRTSQVSSALVMAALLVGLTPSARAQSIERLQFAATSHSTMAYQFILFGGWDGDKALDDTWVWRGAAWEEQSPTRHPERRRDAAMAYDRARREVVLFGGVDQHSLRTTSTPWATVRVYPAVLHQQGTEVYYRDTWIWDGRDWTQRTPAQTPSERSSHAMAYDAARKQVVLFGGMSRDGHALNDTWVWDGGNWKKMNPVNIPAARSWAAMAYDPNHQQLLMFGGQDADGYPLNDTWIWDGAQWTKAEPSGDLPDPRFEAAMDFDPTQKRMLLISGYVEDSSRRGTTANDSWTWDGANWTKLSPTEFELIFDFSESGPFDPKDTNRALVVSVCAPIIWVPRQARKPHPESENAGADQ